MSKDLIKQYKDRWDNHQDVKYWSEGIKVIFNNGENPDWFDPIDKEDWSFEDDKLLIRDNWEFNKYDIKDVHSYSLFSTENGYERYIHETKEWE